MAEDKGKQLGIVFDSMYLAEYDAQREFLLQYDSLETTTEQPALPSSAI